MRKQNLWFVLLLCSCSDAKLKSPASVPQNPQNSPQTQSSNAQNPGNSGAKPDSLPIEKGVPNPESTAVPVGSPTVASPVPVEVVDGQEVLTTCSTCLARAKVLGATIGLQTDISRTYNLGYYKIPPSRNLCDIHFMRSLFDTIADHDGVDSILGNQVAIYCPCDCGWANTDMDGIY